MRKAESEAVVFVSYPEAFGCYVKLERKLRKILSSLSYVSIISLGDPRGFVQKFVADNSSLVDDFKIVSDSDSVLAEATHAIIFDGQEDIDALGAQITNRGGKVRVIKSSLTTVVNKDKGESYDVYIGRGSEFGNPYAIGIDGDREEVISKFAYDFERDFLRGGSELKEKLKRYKGKRLGCHCAPAACHGDVLAEYLNGLDDGK